METNSITDAVKVLAANLQAVIIVGTYAFLVIAPLVILMRELGKRHN